MEPSVKPGDRLTAFGTQLINVHFWLREELARLRRDVDAHLDGRADRPRELRTHCLAFCSALERHHTGEDAAAFPALAARHPELRPVLEELTRDHQQVSELLHRLQELLDRLGTIEPRRVRAELDGLAALLESHFTYEERKIVAALDALDAPGWTGSPPGFLLTTATGGGREGETA
ncbi:hemerythrin domain-containing protein [Nonomuraea zeae]|uniref:Hemerythrin domain-containing protein n=1 Tax=Nonomuraea zeae TaxID=1642303 RepID=A0A5S4FYW7_9ACTN|nr:hemerythrin domain-containing protein [Nonomuraea zeae]TMR25923.1 hemerythrin domain-containing protein [Nonomuraea zeae]